MTVGMTSGSRLRELRKRIGMSQSELARRAGVAGATINLAEHGHHRMSASTRKAVAEALGVSEGALDEPTSPEDLAWEVRRLLAAVDEVTVQADVVRRLLTGATGGLDEVDG